jgi:hypothetical protein
MPSTMLTVMFAASIAAAGQSSSRTDTKTAPPRTVTLTGCIEKASTPTKYTIQDADGSKYEVSGGGIQKFVGKRVQISGTPGSTRLKIKGGLWPTPNVAAQGGAIDPAKAAVAALPGGGATGTGDVDLPTVKVKSIRSLDGGCR